jgi:hypothetical protein
MQPSFQYVLCKSQINIVFAFCTLSYFFVFSSNQVCTHLGTFNWFAHKCCLSILGLKQNFFLCSMFLLSKLFTSSFGLLPLFCCIFSFLLVMAPPNVPFVGFKSHLLFSTSSKASSSNLTSWHFAHPITRTLGDFSYPCALTTSYISLPSNII